MAMFAFVSSITPGPNNMMLLSSGVNFGFRRTIPHMLGVPSGHFVMLLAVGAGLEAVFKQFPEIYQVIKVAGFIYLLYLAWGIANSAAPSESTNAESKPLRFMGAALFQWVNPKAWMMAIGYFSNYMPPNASMNFIVLTCLMFSLINLPAVGLWAYMGNRLEHRLQEPLYRQVFNRTMALLLILSMIPALFV